MNYISYPGIDSYKAKKKAICEIIINAVIAEYKDYFLGSLTNRQRSQLLTTNSYASDVKFNLDFTVDDILSKGQYQAYSTCRQICYYFMRKYTYMTYEQIGEFFGGKNHATILHGCRTIDGRCEVDLEFSEMVDSCNAKIISSLGVLT